MHKLRETMTKELEAIERKGQLSMSDLDKVHKLTDTIKNIDKIEMLESDGGYSEESNWMADGRMYGTSYARGRGRNARRDSMGRYSSDGGYSENDMMYARDNRSGNRGGYGGYSRDGGDMRERLEEMMEEASTPKQREAIKRCMHEIDE
jgi:hypothetical protein